MSRFLPLILVSFLVETSIAQVPKKTLVEHFTNTKCSVCAVRNPGFHTNFNNQQNTIRLSVFPSSPYPACLLHMQNATDSDARTNYYGVYGSTPRLVINGNVIPSSANYSDNNLFSAYQSQFSPVSIRITQKKYGADSIRSIVVIKTVASHTMGAVSLFAVLAEDTVFYQGSNGEPKHFSVFRKSLTNVTGTAFSLPGTIGDSIVFSFRASIESLWNYQRLYTLAAVQETQSKQLVQAEAAEAKSNMASMGIPSNSVDAGFKIFPNPAQYRFTIESAEAIGTLTILNSLGESIYSEELAGNVKVVDFISKPSGIYFVRTIRHGVVRDRGRIAIIR